MAAFFLFIAGILIGWIMNFIIAGYLNGRYALSVNRRYHVGIAVFNAAGWLMVYNIYGFTTRGLTGLFLFSLLLIIAVIDLDKYIIPNSAVILFLITGIIYHFIDIEMAMSLRLLGFCAGLFAPLTVALISRGGIGGGDIKLLGAMGFWVGFPGILYIFFISSFLGGIISIIFLIIKRKNKKDSLPFAPFLAVGFLMLFLFPVYYGHWY